MNAAGIPTTAEEIQPGWLTEALDERYPGIRVADVEIIDQHELTNNHAVLRVGYHEDAGAPPTMFCKIAPLDPNRRDSILASGMGLREAEFYTSLAPTLSMRVPRARVARHAPDGTFVLLLEDFNAAGCRVSDGTWGIEPDAAAVALRELAEMHLRYLDPIRRDKELWWVPVARHNSTYATPMLRYGLEHHRDRLSDHFAQLAELYVERPEALHTAWSVGPKTALHGDPHIGNLFVDHGRVGFLDWDINNISTPLRDVSYFMNLGLSTADRRACEAELLRGYLDIWNSQSGAPIDFNKAWLTHRVHTAYLVPACCQVVTFPADATGRRNAFANNFLALAEAAIEDHEPFSALRTAGAV